MGSLGECRLLGKMDSRGLYGKGFLGSVSEKSVNYVDEKERNLEAVELREQTFVPEAVEGPFDVEGGKIKAVVVVG